MALECATRGTIIVFLLSTIIFLLTLTCSGFPTTFVLEKKTHKNVEPSTLKAEDRARHGHLRGYVNFSVQGSIHLHTSGIYYTRVKLGSPPREFYMKVDTGSNITSVNCVGCNGCPSTSDNPRIQLSYYDPNTSTSASSVSCFDKICMNKDSCSVKHPRCSYSLQYIEGSASVGRYVSDVFYFDTVVGESSITNFSTPIVFGCTTNQSGYFTNPSNAVDGILAFGQGDTSIVSQLSSRHETPKLFSHCLRGGKEGGGVIVLGEIVAQGKVYASLLPNQSHYNLNLIDIALGDNPIAFSQEEFNGQGVVIDSGTTLAYFPAGVYSAITDALYSAIESFDDVTHSDQGEEQCYHFPSRYSLNEFFEPITLHFDGVIEGLFGEVALIVLQPEEYLWQTIKVSASNLTNGLTTWCTAFQQSFDVGGPAVLGAIFLRDKAVTYDLDAQLIGIAPYDCSSSIKVSQTSHNQIYRPRNASTRRLTRHASCRLLLLLATTLYFFHFY